MAKLNFNPSTVPAATTYELIPVGSYLAMAVSTEVKPTKSGTGHYLQIVFEIVDGAAKGRKIFQRLNISNESPTAEKIAQQELAAICKATIGDRVLEDSDELLNIPLTIDVIIEAGKGGYSDQNRIKNYRPASQPAAPVAQAAKAAPTKPVWAR